MTSKFLEGWTQTNKQANKNKEECVAETLAGKTSNIGYLALLRESMPISAGDTAYSSSIRSTSDCGGMHVGGVGDTLTSRQARRKLHILGVTVGSFRKLSLTQVENIQGMEGKHLSCKFASKTTGNI